MTRRHRMTKKPKQGRVGRDAWIVGILEAPLGTVWGAGTHGSGPALGALEG